MTACVTTLTVREAAEAVSSGRTGKSDAPSKKKGVRFIAVNNNALMAAIKRAIAKIREWLTDVKEAIMEIDMQPKEVLLVDLLIQRFNERKDERNDTWDGYYGKQKATVKDLQRFADITAYMREKDIRTVEDLDKRLDELSSAGRPTRDQIREVSSRIRTIEKLLEAGERRDRHAPVHDQYLKIHWKGRKEKFAKEHKEELDAWSQADRYVRKYLPDQPFSADALESELSSLNAYVIGLHFSETSKDTLEDKVKKLIKKDVEDGNF